MSGPKLLGIRDVTNPFEGLQQSVVQAGGIYQQYEQDRMKAQAEQERVRLAGEAGMRDEGRLTIAKAEEGRLAEEAKRKEAARSALRNFAVDRTSEEYIPALQLAALNDAKRQELEAAGNDREARERIEQEYVGIRRHFQDRSLAEMKGVSRLVAEGVPEAEARARVQAATANMVDGDGRYEGYVGAVKEADETNRKYLGLVAELATAQAAGVRAHRGIGDGDGAVRATQGVTSNTSTPEVVGLEKFLDSMTLGSWDTPSALRNVYNGVELYNLERTKAGLPPIAADSPFVKDLINKQLRVSRNISDPLRRSVGFSTPQEFAVLLEENAGLASNKDHRADTFVDVFAMTRDQLAGTKSVLSREEFDTQSTNLLIAQLRGIRPSTTTSQTSRLPVDRQDLGTAGAVNVEQAPDGNLVQGRVSEKGPSEDFDWDSVQTTGDPQPRVTPQEQALAQSVVREHDLRTRLDELLEAENALGGGANPERGRIRTERGRIRSELASLGRKTGELRDEVEKRRRLEALPAEGPLPRDLRRLVDGDVRSIGADRNPALGLERLKAATAELEAKRDRTAAENYRLEALRYEIDRTQRRLPLSMR